MFDDLKVLGKRQIGNILKWRGKILHQLHIQADKERRVEQEQANKE